MMTFEYGRYMRATIGLFANDQTACFDRMWPKITNITADVVGCDPNVQKCREETMDLMERYCKTGLGVSKSFYDNKPAGSAAISDSQTESISELGSTSTVDSESITETPPSPKQEMEPAVVGKDHDKRRRQRTKRRQTPKKGKRRQRQPRQSTQPPTMNPPTESPPPDPPPDPSSDPCDKIVIRGLYDVARARIKGEIQGKADVASMWLVVSSILLLAHSQVYEGIDLPSVVGKEKGIKKNNDGYVDDVDTWSGKLGWGREVADEVMHKLKGGAQSWSDIQDVVAASTAFHKCMCQVLAHIAKNGSLVIDYDYTFDMHLHDVKGATTKIQFKPPNEPNQGLGFNIAPDGNQKHEFNSRIEKIRHMCKAAVSMHLSQREAHTMLNRRLVPQTTYGMRLSQFNEKQCHQLDVVTLGTFLPLLIVNRSTPRAVVHGPTQYGGMNIVKHMALQDQWGLHYFVQSLCWDDIIANDIITVLDAYQLVSGFVTPVLETPDVKLDYVGVGWINHIRHRLRAIDGSLVVEKAWQPKLQRLGDDSIMERIVASKHLMPREKQLANEFRLFIRVTCISCLATNDGKGIPFDRLTGHWRAPALPSKKWLDLPEPTKAHAAVFRRCL